jgi:hypothetical protein
LRLWDGEFSEGVVRQAVWLSGLVAYEQAEAILEQVGQVQISRMSIWRRVQSWGQRLGEMAEAGRNQAMTLSKPEERLTSRLLTEAGAPWARRQGVALDGVLIPLREEGWKEVKLATFFEVARADGSGASAKSAALAQATAMSYVTHLGGPEYFGELVWSEAQRRQWEQCQEVETLGDGAVWIWNLVAEHFPHSQQVVDFYHALEHLAAAGRLLKGEGSIAFARWFNSRTTLLYQGQAAVVAAELTQAAERHPALAEQLRREAAYFATHQHRMHYLELRENGWLIGSGMVESGAKQIKRRFAGPGMHWSRTGAEHLLPVRAAILSNRFDDLWSQAYAMPLN